nr:hypothetical protein [Sphingomonas mali]
MIERAERQQAQFGIAVRQDLRRTGGGAVAARDDHPAGFCGGFDRCRNLFGVQQADVGGRAGGREGLFQCFGQRVTHLGRSAAVAVHDDGHASH